MTPFPSITMNTPASPAAAPVYDLAYFRSFFAAIPDSLWIAGCLGNKGGPRCAVGHASSEGMARVAALATLFDSLGQYAIININNGNHPRYQQSTPRARILAAIDDLIAMDAAKQAAELDAVEVRALVPVSRPAVAPAAVESPLLVEVSS